MAAHATLDRSVEAAAFFASRDGYGRYLQRSHLAHRRYETALDGIGVDALVPDWAARRKAARLAADLDDLAMPPLPADALPRWRPNLRRDHATMLGTLYVIEGATLGARVLLPRVEALGLSAHFGARGLAHQAGAHDAWRRFLDLLESAALDARDEDAAAEAALHAFAHFHAYLSDPL